MANLLKFLGIASIIAGLVVGYIQADKAVELIGLGRSLDMPFQWTVALTWWISGFISGIVLYAIGMILDKLNQMQNQFDQLNTKTIQPYLSPEQSKIMNSKMNLESAKGYKMNSIE